MVQGHGYIIVDPQFESGRQPCLQPVKMVSGSAVIDWLLDGLVLVWGPMCLVFQ